MRYPHSRFRSRERGRPCAHLGDGLRPAGERRAQKLNPCKAAHARGGDVPTGESKCWAGEITDPHYGNEKPPRPSQTPSLVTWQSTFCLLTHSSQGPLMRRLSHRGLCLPHYHHAPGPLPALIHYTHHFYLSHQNMIYMVIYFTALYWLPPPHVLYHLGWVLHRQQWTFRPSPWWRKKNSPSPPHGGHQPSHSRQDRLASSPGPTSVFWRMLSSTNQRRRKWADKWV